MSSSVIDSNQETPKAGILSFGNYMFQTFQTLGDYYSLVTDHKYKVVFDMKHVPIDVS